MTLSESNDDPRKCHWYPLIICYIAWWFSSWIYPLKLVDLSIVMLVYQRVNLHFPIIVLWFSYGFPMKTSIFLWFSYGSPMVFLWFSYGFPIKTSIFLWFSYVFPLKHPFSYGFPMVFPLKPPFSYGFPIVFPLKPPFSYGFPMVFQTMPTWYPLVHQGIPSPDPRYPRCHVAELPGGLPRRIFAEAKTQLVGLVNDRLKMAGFDEENHRGIYSLVPASGTADHLN